MAANNLSRSFSWASLPLLALAFVALVAASSLLLRGARIDLTDKRVHTLSEGTQRILGRIEEPVALKLYYSEKAARDYAQFRVFAQRVIEMLEEVSARSGGKVTLEVIDPEPFSPAEEQAVAYGLSGVPLGESGDTLYFGLVGNNSTDGETIMPFIQPDKEAFLEYDVAKLISTLSVDTKPVVALLSSLPTGPSFDMATGQPRPGWVVDRQLSEMFELRRLQPDPTAIADDVDLLMLVHPKELAEDTLYAIDQFVLRGGHLLVFVDPDSEVDSAGMSVMDPAAMGAAGSDLAPLFAAWGVQYDPGKVLLDSRHALQVQPNADQPPERHLAVLGLGRDALNQQDVVSAEIEVLHFASAGSIALAPGSTLKLEPLAQSSTDSMLVDAEQVRMARSNPALLREGFAASGAAKVIAARLGGPLATAFPARSGEGHLANSAAPVNIIVVADSDVLTDRLWVLAQDFMGQAVYNPFAGNGDFVYNAVDNLVGNADLIAVRTRASATRPFTRIVAMRRTAEAQYQAKQKELEQRLQELEANLARLQPSTPEGGPQQITAEQSAQLQEFQQERVRIRRELRDVQHQLNADIERLGAELKFVNIVTMPAVVVVLTLLLAWRRRSRRNAVAGADAAA